MTSVDWVGLLADEDVEGLWNGLYQLVSRHPAVKPLRFTTDGAAVSSQVEINADLAQELFLELFQKERFQYYADNNYSSIAIENELARIEVPNLVGARLRKRYPESFRMARRVSSLLKESPRFKRFGAGSADPPKRRGRPKRIAKPQVEQTFDEEIELMDSHEEDAAGPQPKRSRMVNQLFGLREWKDNKPARDSGHFQEMVKAVPVRKRDTRIVGRSGSSQLILSNADLEELVVEVLKTIDSPADVRTIRQLVLSKIPLQDYNIASLDEEFTQPGDGSSFKREAIDWRDTPEATLLRGEQSYRVAQMAEEFLVTLRQAVNNNERRYTRLLSTLWHCYYNPTEPSQLEIAEILGVSDSLVSDNRKLIEYELKKLELTLDDGQVFSESLQRLVAPGTS
ncbi:MAG TPA: hypothetical protein VKM94_22900 [Blastocatellia bacterium]|nr:hypothetical protein [Blastocatellia bacterium]